MMVTEMVMMMKKKMRVITMMVESENAPVADDRSIIMIWMTMIVMTCNHCDV